MAVPFSPTGPTSLTGYFERQHGLITTAQALRAGLSHAGVSRRLRAGVWLPVHQGVHRLAGVRPSWRARLLAAVLACGPPATASHASAARLLGLSRVAAPEPLEICAVGSSLPLLRGVCVHRTRRLDPCDVTVADGVPATSAARLLVDLAGRLNRSALVAAMDDAICARLVGGAWLHRRARALRAGRRGVGHLVRWTAPGSEGEFRSWLERRAAAVFRAHRVRPPAWNSALHDERGLIGVVDALFAEERLVVELEGLRFHTTPEQRGNDAARFNRLGIAGWLSLRYTWLDVVERPAAVAEEVRRALARRRRVD